MITIMSGTLDLITITSSKQTIWRENEYGHFSNDAIDAHNTRVRVLC